MMYRKEAWQTLKEMGFIKGRKNWPTLWRELWKQVVFGKQGVTE